MSALHVRALAVWTPRFPSWQAWSSRAASEPSVPAAHLLGARVRGRASVLTRMIAEVVSVAATSARLELAQTPLFVGSAFGEMDTTAQLLAMMSEGDGALSPARFQSSVHNAAAGAISIATGNQRFSTCLAAGEATTAALLLEVRAYLAEHGGDALVVMADEQLPAFFGGNDPYEAAAAALVLSSEPAHAIATLGSEQRVAQIAEQVARHERDAEVGATPVAPMLALIDAMIARREHVLLPLLNGQARVPLRYGAP
jgi:hypothetical protein